MDNIINKIIEIDERALKIKEETEKIISENKERLEEELKAIEATELKKAREEGEEAYNTRVNQGKDMADAIISKGEERFQHLEKRYESHQEKLTQSVLNILFD